MVVLNSDHWITWKASGNQNPREIIVLRTLSMCLFPLVPAMIISSSEEAKDQRKALERAYQKNNRVIDAHFIEEYMLGQANKDLRLF